MPTEGQYIAAGGAIQGLVEQVENLLSGVEGSVDGAQLKGNVLTQVRSALDIASGNKGLAVSGLLQEADWCFDQARRARNYTEAYDAWQRDPERYSEPAKIPYIDYG